MHANPQTTRSGRWIVFLALAVLLSAGQLPRFPAGRASGSRTGISSEITVPAGLPRPDHVVIVIEENKGYDDIFKTNDAPYLKSLAQKGALLTNVYALHHPSQPNYIELFSGGDRDVFNDDCPPLKKGVPFAAPSLGGQLLKKGIGFAGYVEGLPPSAVLPPSSKSDWNPLCNPKTRFVERHCPWMDFADVPASASLDFTKFPTTAAGFNSLPAVAFVIPDLVNDMHGLKHGEPVPPEVAAGDKWLQAHLDAYAQWATANNSLLIVTWDEDSSTYKLPKNPSQKINTQPPQNHIPTLLVGAMVKPGATSDQTYTQYDLLRTVEDMYGLEPLGGAKGARDIAGIWKQ